VRVSGILSYIVAMLSKTNKLEWSEFQICGSPCRVEQMDEPSGSIIFRVILSDLFQLPASTHKQSPHSIPCQE
jgi:hypothetical protein